MMEEVEVDPPNPMEIRLKVVCTSLCRSDVSQWESKVNLSFTVHLHCSFYLFSHIDFLIVKLRRIIWLLRKAL